MPALSFPAARISRAGRAPELNPEDADYSGPGLLYAVCGVLFPLPMAITVNVLGTLLMAGLSYGHVRSVWGKSPVEWSKETRDKILAALGLKARLVIEEIDE